jgi:hypothetical protein
LVNLGISTFTGSLRSEVNLIEAYTASLKGAAIVSSSQQITNYYKFAETASANHFYGNQSIGGELKASILRTDSHAIVSDGSAAAVVLQGYINNALRIAESGSASSGGSRGMLYVGAIDVGGTTAFAENLVMASGKGIDFSATANSSGTMTSELLNDYEEGTWTPTFTTSISGTITVNTTAGYSEARYTKIGRQVTVAGTFTVLSVSSPVGEWRIEGLPFTSEAGAGKRSAVSVFADALETTATTSIVGYIDPNVTYITLYKYAAGAVSNMAADVKAGSYVFLTATYNV